MSHEQFPESSKNPSKDYNSSVTRDSMQEQFSQRERRALMNRETVTHFIENSFDPYMDKRKYGR